MTVKNHNPPDIFKHLQKHSDSHDCHPSLSRRLSHPSHPRYSTSAGGLPLLLVMISQHSTSQLQDQTYTPHQILLPRCHSKQHPMERLRFAKILQSPRRLHLPTKTGSRHLGTRRCPGAGEDAVCCLGYERGASCVDESGWVDGYGSLDKVVCMR